MERIRTLVAAPLAVAALLTAGGVATAVTAAAARPRSSRSASVRRVLLAEEGGRGRRLTRQSGPA